MESSTDDTPVTAKKRTIFLDRITSVWYNESKIPVAGEGTPVRNMSNHHTNDRRTIMKYTMFTRICLVVGILLMIVGIVVPGIPPWIVDPEEIRTGIIGGAGMTTYAFILFHTQAGSFSRS